MSFTISDSTFTRKYQLLRQNRRRPDCGGRHITSTAHGTTALGGRPATSLGWTHRSHTVQRLDLRHPETIIRRLLSDPVLQQRVERLESMGGVGPITALTWALEVADPHRFSSIADAVSYCGLTAAFRSSAGKQQRGPISKQRNAWLQTALIEAAKLAPRWNPQLAALHAQQLERGHPNRATLQVARKLVAYLLAVDKSGQPFQAHTPPPLPITTRSRKKRKKAAALAPAA